MLMIRFQLEVVKDRIDFLTQTQIRNGINAVRT